MIEIYKASAGSGKTFTLTREYIKFILGYKDENGKYHLNRGRASSHRSVLAITFTNKATEEMKTRIIHELAVLAGAEPGWKKKSPYLDELCEVFSCTPTELADSAGKALRELLFDFDRFSVSTIDAFFQTVLRAFAHEADVSGNYDLELDDSAVIGIGVDRMLQDLNRQQLSSESRYVIEWLTKYMIGLIEKGKTFNIFNKSSKVNAQLIRFINDITDDIFKAHSEEILSYLRDSERFIAFIEAMNERIREIKGNVIQKCRTAVEYVDSMDGILPLVNLNVLKPIRAWSQKGWSTAPSATLKKAIADVEKAYKDKGKISPLRNPMLDALLHDALQAIDTAYKEQSFFSILTANLYQLGLLGTIMNYVERYGKENSTILLSDTNTILSKIIGDEDSPFLYEKIGNTYRNFLIDEFQDTSFSQWQNIRPLFKESLATDNDNLVIGDEKQCIYRFRNSDPTLLKNLHEDEVAVGRSVIRGNRISENTNWRSSREVVQFNNTLFTAISAILGFSDVYENVAQKISKKHADHDGYVRLEIFPEAKDNNYVERALDSMTANLRRQLESGYKPGEIAILVRRWKEGDAIIAHLEKVRNEDPSFPPFNIVSDKSLLISRSRSVKFIISNLRFLALSPSSAVRGKRSKNEVAKMINEFEAAISNKFSPSEALEIAVSRMNTAADSDIPSLSETSGMDLISLIESIVSQLPAGSREEDNIYLSAFQDLVIDFMAKGRSDIRSFLEWWDEQGSKLSVSGAKDDMALNILTVHKSKGLEYRCVHVPFAAFKDGNFADTKWFRLDSIPGIDPGIIPPWIPLNISASMTGTPLEKEYIENCLENQLDQLNLLYVAFTRAIDELIIGLGVPEKVIEGTDKVDSSLNLTPSRFIYKALYKCTGDFVECLDNEKGGNADFEVPPFIPLSISGDGIVEVGQPTVANDIKEEKGSAMEPGKTRLESEYSLSNNNSIWKNTRLERDVFAKTLSARERGLIIHDILSRVVTASDVDGALNILQTLPATIGATVQEKRDISDIVRQRVSDPIVKDWFEGFERVLIEREVITAGGETKRFDRVVWTAGGEIHLIDYKSGSQSPEKYKKQISSYIDFFKSMGYSKVRGFLYYLDTGKVIEI